MLKNFFRCTLLVLAAGLSSLRAAYNPAVVAADARWVIFADLNGLRASALGKEFVTTMTHAQSMATGGMVGLDIPKVLATVGTLTAYGTNLSSDPSAIDGTLIAQGTADLRKIAESLLLQGTLAHPEVFSEVSDLPFPAYAISDPKAAPNARTQLVVAFPPEPIVVVSKSKAQLVKARDVFRGASPSLQTAGQSSLNQLGNRVAGAYLFAASVVPPTEGIFAPNAPQTRLLQLASSGAIAFGERGADTFAHAELVASSEANAEKLMKILQGLTAMLSLAESNDRQLADFLNATGVSREKETVTLKLAYPSARLVQMVQTLRTQAEARPVNRPPTITAGRTIAEWDASSAAAPDEANLSWRTIENVQLANGATVTLGRALNGGKSARFDRVEIIPANGSGAPLVFKSEFMRGMRGTMSQFSFPGADGIYTLKVAYVNDPDGKAKFAVSVSEPKAPTTPTPPAPPAPAPRE